MPSPREHLRARIAGVLEQEPHKRRDGNELKRAIVDYTFTRQDEHATIREIAEDLGLSAWLFSKWLRHARLRLEKGKIPFEPGEFLSMPWLDPKEPATEPSAADSSPSPAEPTAAGSAPSSLPATSTASGGPNPGQASTPRCIVIPATTLAEFLTDVDAMGRHLHVLEYLLGREGDPRGQG